MRRPMSLCLPVFSRRTPSVHSEQHWDDRCHYVFTQNPQCPQWTVLRWPMSLCTETTNVTVSSHRTPSVHSEQHWEDQCHCVFTQNPQCLQWTALRRPMSLCLHTEPPVSTVNSTETNNVTVSSHRNPSVHSEQYWDDQYHRVFT